MSLGLGILLSTILALLVWQIDKRGAWKKARTGMLVAVGLAVVLVGSWFAYLHFHEAQNLQVKRTEISRDVMRVASGEFTEYWDLMVGMTQDEVLYKKGEPTTKREGNKESRARWQYGDGDAGTAVKIVLWDDDSRVVGIACQSRGYHACPAIAGIRDGDPENSVAKSFGLISANVEIDRGLKMIDYERPPMRVRFALQEERVIALLVSKLSATEATK